MKKLSAGCIAEFVGTFALVFIGAGSAVIASAWDAPGVALMAVGLAHACVLVVFVTGLLAVSGSQFNPAVSVALVVSGRQSIGRGGAFIAAQLAASALAAWSLLTLLGPGAADPEGARLGATVGAMTLDGRTAGVFALEAVMTFFLMWVILTCIVDARAPRSTCGVCVGLVVLACVLFGAPLTGASLNPARTFGPALAGEQWRMHWVYWAAPITGALAATGLYALMQRLEGPAAMHDDEQLTDALD